MLQNATRNPHVPARASVRRWVEAALQDAGLRDMPLHALRHTAAAAWLAGGNSLRYVQQQLGHGDIRTTEHYYGHLERSVLAEGARATEEAIARAAGDHDGRKQRPRIAGARGPMSGVLGDGASVPFTPFTPPPVARVTLICAAGEGVTVP